MQEDQEIIELSVVTRPEKHFDAKWKFEGAFQQLEFQQLEHAPTLDQYHHRRLNESIYEIPLELREKVTVFLQEMQKNGEIEEFFFNDQLNDLLELALIALKKAETQNCFQNDAVVQRVIAAVKAAKESEEK